MLSPRLYATFLLWLLSELFEELPEVGDPDKPQARLLLRRGASPVRRRAEGAGREGRAGGAADPLQGRRRLFRHAEPARRARQRAGASSATACSTRCAPIRRASRRRCSAAAETFRPNPDFDATEAITQLGVGEALVSTLGRRGVPTMVERTLIRPPSSRLGPDHAGGAPGDASPRARSPASTTQPVDRESAFERARRRRARRANPPRRRTRPTDWRTQRRGTRGTGWNERPATALRGPRPADGPRQFAPPISSRGVRSDRRLRSVGSQLGRELVSGILGSLRR